MKVMIVTGVWGLLASLALGMPRGGAVAAGPALEAPLTAEGRALEAKYDEQLRALRADIAKALPKVEEPKKAAFLKAYQDEAAATAAELKALRAQGGKRVKDKEAATQAHEAAKLALAQARANARTLSAAILHPLATFLADDGLDARLVQCAVLTEATPRGLAAFAQQGKEQEALAAKLLADAALMKQMLLAGGASEGQYGRALQIYMAIQAASPKAGEGLFQRLALGTALEHAVPVPQSHPQAATNAPAFVDPVKRYLHFEKACLDGELDPGFKDLTAWDYRMVVDGDEPDSILAWGREMLRNYRPDHISTPDYRWRYVKAVKTDVQYGSQEQKNDLPTLHPYQNMINTGGVCGRRAFFGRFILRCFGIPTVARPQSGHAALAHWTPGGWVINLGAGWEWGWTRKHGEGLDFLATTQARNAGSAYEQVQRARWIGGALGEARCLGFHDEPSGFWNGVALYRQRAIIEESKAVALAAVGQDIAEANESKEEDVAVKVEGTEADRTILAGADGVITIPAAACVNTSTNAGTIVFMKSPLGGLQMHYERVGKPATFECTVQVPQAGTYALSARVVTVSPGQNLRVRPNDAQAPIVLPLPYTVGMWQKSEPVEIALAKGKNVLQFYRVAPYRGLTIRDFTLTPAN
jgi:hypothetical protein